MITRDALAASLADLPVPPDPRRADRGGFGHEISPGRARAYNVAGIGVFVALEMWGIAVGWTWRFLAAFDATLTVGVAVVLAVVLPWLGRRWDRRLVAELARWRVESLRREIEWRAWLATTRLTPAPAPVPVPALEDAA